MKLINILCLASHLHMTDFSWIGDMFAFTLVFYVLLSAAFGKALAVLVKHPGAEDCGNEENCLLYVSEKLFFKDSSPLIQEASVLNELVGIPEL